MKQAKIVSRIIKADYDDGSLLMLEIEIDCPLCGPFPIQIVVAGHHLKLVRDLCIEAIDAYPELTGGGEITVTKGPTTIKGRVNDPSTS